MPYTCSSAWIFFIRSTASRARTLGASFSAEHRIKLTLYKIDQVINGDLDEIIDSLIAADQAEKLSHMEEE